LKQRAVGDGHFKVCDINSGCALARVTFSPASATSGISQFSVKAITPRENSLFPAAELPFCAIDPAIGLVQWTAIIARSGPAPFPVLLPCFSLSRFWRAAKTDGSVASPVNMTEAVGHEYNSFAAMAVSGFARAENSDRTAIAHCFQCWDECGKLSVCIPRHVFAHETKRPALIDDTQDLIGEKSLVIGPAALSGDAVWLARVSASDDIHDAAPRSSVEAGKVRPDRSRMKPPCRHRRNQSCGGAGFPLHVTNCAILGHGQSDAKVETSDTGTQGNAEDGTCSHIHSPAPMTSPWISESIPRSISTASRRSAIIASISAA
jgi:hypothetical protein